MVLFKVTRERGIGLLVAFLVGCVVVFCGLRWIEFSITFHPTRAVFSERPRHAEDVWFTTADRVRLHGWYFPSETTPSAATIIYFHGNGGNISNLGWVGERLAKRGFDVLLFDYRGYGESEGEPRDESGLYADGDAAYAYVINGRHVSPNKVVLHGQSLGTTVVTDLASRQTCAAIILESGLSSESSVATTALPWLPRWLHFLGRNRFDSARKLVNVHVPVLVSHGEPDPVIPTDEGRALFGAANEPKKFLIFPGAGHNVFGSMGDQYLGQIDKFVRDAVLQ
jgi:fermentation-respiration switch protein FrsA (DUF1100 family)